jgi:hypothetical protein
MGSGGNVDNGFDAFGYIALHPAQEKEAKLAAKDGMSLTQATILPEESTMIGTSSSFSSSFSRLDHGTKSMRV